MKPEKKLSEYSQLIENISVTYNTGQSNSKIAINTHLLETYWKIGQYIVEFEQNGNTKAEYGKALLENLAKDLTILHGRGFSRSNLNYMRMLYDKYPICEKPSHKLSWFHYVELLKIDHDLERSFYEKLKSVKIQFYDLFVFNLRNLCNLWTKHFSEWFQFSNQFIFKFSN